MPRNRHSYSTTAFTWDRPLSLAGRGFDDYSAAVLLTRVPQPGWAAHRLLPSQIAPMTGLRRKRFEAVYSGGTVRGSHTVLYSPVRGETSRRALRISVLFMYNHSVAARQLYDRILIWKWMNVNSLRMQKAHCAGAKTQFLRHIPAACVRLRNNKPFAKRWGSVNDIPRAALKKSSPGG